MRESKSEKPDGKLLYHDITQVILGAFYAVHTELGAGFLEPVYSNAVTVMLRNAGLKVEREVWFEVIFHGETIGRFRADLVVESKVVVEVKAARWIDPAHCAQLLNYLRTSSLEVGLLLNFGKSAQFKRIVSTVKRRGREIRVPRSGASHG